MAKPFGGLSGSSSHLHISLWRDGRPAFAAQDGAEPALTRHVVAGLLNHLPGITLYGAPTVNSYKRFEPGSFAPTTAAWGGDNRTVAVRSLLETPEATRIELRSPAADANPYWAVASALAAVIAGIDEAEEPPAKGSGNLYGVGPAPALDPRGRTCRSTCRPQHHQDPR
jgi:glutamine synthetase